MPVTSRPCSACSRRTRRVGRGVEASRDHDGGVEGREVLLQPDDLVALVALGQRRPARVGERRRGRRGGGPSARPRRRRSVACHDHHETPPAAVAGPERAEARDVLGRRVVVGLAERRDRGAVDAVVGERVGADRVDGAADVLPVDLRQVRLRAAGAEEDRVRQPRVVVDVGERREARSGSAGPIAGAQRGDVLLRLRRSGPRTASRRRSRGSRRRRRRRRRRGRLAERVVAVDVLPGAHAQAVGVQRGDELGRELRPAARRRRRRS